MAAGRLERMLGHTGLEMVMRTMYLNDESLRLHVQAMKKRASLLQAVGLQAKEQQPLEQKVISTQASFLGT